MQKKDNHKNDSNAKKECLAPIVMHLHQNDHRDSPNAATQFCQVPRSEGHSPASPSGSSATEPWGSGQSFFVAEAVGHRKAAPNESSLQGLYQIATSTSSTSVDHAAKQMSYTAKPKPSRINLLHWTQPIAAQILLKDSTKGALKVTGQLLADVKMLSPSVAIQFDHQPPMVSLPLSEGSADFPSSIRNL